MDSAKLKAFLVVAEELNFRKSAEILGMSQPPLSRLIAGLEEELGVKLFERTTRQVSLTGPGILFLKKVRPILTALEKLKDDIAEEAKIKQGKLTLGFSSTAFLARFPVIVEEFQKLYPKIRLELQQGNQREILKGVPHNEFDLGFVEGVTSYKDLESLPISEEVLGALVKKNHRLAKKTEIEFKDLGEETIILHHQREAEEFYKSIVKLIQGLDKPPKIYIRQNGESCPILVATGKGISLTIEGAHRSLVEGTRFIPIKDMFLPVALFWRGSNSNPSLQKFLSATAENRSLRLSPTHCLHLNNRLGDLG